MIDRAALLQHCRGLVAQGKSHEEMLVYLRQQGCTKVQSIALLVEGAGIALPEAKETVHGSKTWQDIRERDEKFQDELEREAKKPQK